MFLVGYYAQESCIRTVKASGDHLLSVVNGSFCRLSRRSVVGLYGFVGSPGLRRHPTRLLSMPTGSCCADILDFSRIDTGQLTIKNQ